MSAAPTQLELVDRLDHAAELDGMPIHSVLGGLARLHQLVVVCSSDGRVLWLSDALGAICGDRAEFIGCDFHELLSGSTEEYDDLAAALRSGQSFRGHRLRLQRGPDEPALEADLSAFSIDDGRGGEPLLVGIVRPAKPSSAATSSAGEGVLGALLDASPGAVIAIDAAGFVTYANRAAEDVLGWPREDLIDRPLALLMSSAGGFGQLMADLQSGNESDRDLRVTRPDGKRVTLAVSSRPLLLPSGESAGTAAFLRDVTDRERLEHRLEQKTKELDRYVRTVSHDLRSPLVAVLGFARLLRDDYGSRLDADGSRFLERIEQGGRSMQALIEDTLELSRIREEVRRDASTVPQRILRQIDAQLKPRLEQSDARLHLVDAPHPIACEPTHLYRLISSLVDNALTHGHVAGRSLEIEVEIEALPDFHRIRVSDDGVGIAPEEHDRIFEVFQTIGERGRAEGRRATGMGLAIVKRIAECYGGTAWVESDAGHGASFFATIARSD